MRHSVNLAIILGLVLSGLPHAFCNCGCAETAVREAAPSCPHCGGDDSDSTPRQSNPCECQVCQIVKGVPPGPVVKAPSLDLSSRVSSAPSGLSVQGVLGHSPEQICGASPPTALPRSYCALPILFGHLLF